MSHLWQDIRYALRSLLKTPAFTLVALLTLALGIGANSAIFSVVNGVLLRSLPYPDADRLVVIRETYGDGLTGTVSGPNFLDWRERSHSFESMAASRPITLALLGVGEPEAVAAAMVSSDFFRTLATPMVLGRGLQPGEDRGQGTVAVISEGLWRERFGADREILGRSLNLSGSPYTIVGVAPSSLTSPGQARIWVPLGYGLGQSSARGSHSYDVIARLAPGATVATAQADLDAVARALTEAYPDPMAGRGVTVIPMTEDTVGAVRPALLLLSGAVLLVLLIACANVANLFLVRATTRQRELALRAALGASRWRLTRQTLAEAVILAGAGGLLGLLLASWSVEALLALGPRGVPRLTEIGIDGHVLGFTLIVSLLVGIAFGLVPAIVATAHHPNEALQSEGRGVSGGRQRNRLRGGMVVAQIALALILLVGSALLIVSVRRLAGVDPGFRPEGAVSFEFNVPSAKYQNADAQRKFIGRVLDRLEAIPGVSHAGSVFYLPLGKGESSGDVSVEGEPAAAPGHEHFAGYRIIMGEYLESMDIALKRGRSLRPEDRAGAGLVAVVNEAFAREFFPGRDPLGQRITFGDALDEPEWREVVGIAADVRHAGLARPAEPEVYVPAQQIDDNLWSVFVPSPLSFVVRTGMSSGAIAAAIKDAVREVDPEQPISRLRPVGELITDALARYRFSMLLLTIFGGLALCLSVVGVYGLMAYSVSQRTRELGIRLALGARGVVVCGMVLRQGLLMALAGIVLGLIGALALTRLLTAQLFGVSPTDPGVIATMAATLAVVSAIACLIPAIRATRVDPVVALRSD